MAREALETDWTSVIAKTLAFLCIHQAELQHETLVKQSAFLERFGLPRSEAALVLGTTERSLTEMKRQQKSRGRRASTTRKSSTTGRRTAGR